MITIVNKIECCGCEACVNACPKNCIRMVSDEEGFLYPKVNSESCIQCGLCERVCPVINYTARQGNDAQEACLLQHKDESICSQSTAGGAFTGIATYVLEKGGIVFGVEMTERYEVRHTSVETVEELNKFRNSKYVQSRIGNVYQQVKKELKSGRWVCFSGTPCQIEGLRHYLNKDYEKLVLVDVVCRAVPSPGIWKKYINYESKQKGAFLSIRFRDKALGYQYSTMALKNRNGKTFRGGIESQPWLRMFFSGMIIRPSCTDCKFRSRYRNSDFTIWDCFNTYSLDRTFDEDRGTTRMLIHTEKAKDIFKEIQNNYICKALSAGMAVAGVQEMVSSPAPNKRKAEFMMDLQSESMDMLLNKYFPMSGKVKAKKTLRLILNRVGLDKTVKHILKKG